MQNTFSHTILVVDDNALNLHLLTTILTGAEYTVLTCGNAEEAQEITDKSSPDIILLDVMMPGMDGFSLCRELKQNKRFSDIPVIFLTSLSQQEDIVEGFNAGGSDYIVKPFNRQELLARVRNHIRLHDMLMENKRLTRLSEDASRSKTEFLASMSHEIRTPLNSIIGMAEVLSETPLSREQQQFVSIFRSAGESLLEIINDILDLSKIEAGQTELEAIDFHLSSLLDSVVSILSVRAAEQNTRISTYLAPTVPDAISGDPTRLRQILINLLGNSLKFTENGSVDISVQTDSTDTLLFSVEDDGIGIPPDKQKLIFESFTQADSLTTRKYGGTGLGLTICQKLVTMMGGKIWLESTADLGSTFFFTYPFQKAVNSPLPAAEKHNPPISCELLPTARILLVDDNEDNRNLLCLYLRNTPFLIDTAQNGLEAVEAFCRNSYDLVFMDIEMPTMDGYEATRKIRRWENSEQQSATPIIALTAHAFVRFRNKCLEVGCSDYLTKPVRKNTLLQTIHTHLNIQPNAQTAEKEQEAPPMKPDTQDLPHVILDAKIRKLIPRFLENKKADIVRMQETLESDKYEELKKQAHTVKGTSWMYGFKSLGDNCLKLEKAAAAGDRKLAEHLLTEVAVYLDTVIIGYRSPDSKNDSGE